MNPFKEKNLFLKLIINFLRVLRIQLDISTFHKYHIMFLFLYFRDINPHIPQYITSVPWYVGENRLVFKCILFIYFNIFCFFTLVKSCKSTSFNENDKMFFINIKIVIIILFII